MPAALAAIGKFLAGVLAAIASLSVWWLIVIGAVILGLILVFVAMGGG